jgi:hypothetical protein
MVSLEAKPRFSAEAPNRAEKFGAAVWAVR